MPHSLRIVLVLATVGGLFACRPAERPTSSPAPTPPPAVATPVDAETITMTGHGALRFGMTLAEASTALGESIEPASEGCYVMTPASAGTPPRFTWLVVDGVVARADVTDAAIVAEGGGRVGMAADDLRGRYAGTIVEGPSKYDPAGHTWVVGPADAAHFVFELDASDHVVGWRAGVPPQVDWVERCG